MGVAARETVALGEQRSLSLGRGQGIPNVMHACALCLVPVLCRCFMNGSVTDLGHSFLLTSRLENPEKNFWFHWCQVHDCVKIEARNWVAIVFGVSVGSINLKMPQCRRTLVPLRHNSHHHDNQEQGRPVTQRNQSQVQQTEFHAGDEEDSEETTRKEDESDSPGVRAPFVQAIADLRS